ncbi:Tetratricopeptide repeat-containing protein [Formivibrio citricus]|uniref:Tetratricopeptide repeat-containing protein n=1 Tax=Formivibrio citricus TaxID=83765 RepID=A0A1I4WYJ9_9NEIS|nr:LytR C-terminal domain-containing protein [Formivibrio citricus]SFN18824.1 Tetratricopeptide repeat-containing protein [Formivibrio citricus]
MKTQKILLPMVCCLPFLGSCSMLQTASNKLWGSNPVYSVNKTTETPDSLYQQGRYYQGQQRYEQAAVAYRKALSTDPGFVEARNGLGVILALQGRLDEAVKEFQTAIKLAPAAAHIHNNLGHTLYLQGNYAAAVTALEQALVLAPDNRGTLSNLNLAYAKTGNPGYTPPANVSGTNLQVEGSPSQAVATTQDPPPPQTQTGRDNAPQLIPIESRGQLEAVQLAPNIYEIRERAPLPQTSKVQIDAPTRKTAATATPAQLRLEISNGNGVNGFAKKVSTYLGKQGYPTSRLTNQKPFQVEVTQIQYRPGFRDEAQRLKSSLPGNMELVQSDKLRQNIQARLLLGKDVAANVAQFESRPAVHVAKNDPSPKGGASEK